MGPGGSRRHPSWDAFRTVSWGSPAWEEGEVDVSAQPIVLVAGATGYVGGKLVPCLLREGYRVRALVRDPGPVRNRPWSRQVEVAQGDVLRPETLLPAMEGVESAYYLVHAMAEGPGFHSRDVAGAENFGTAAREAGVKRILYLGGLGNPATRLSQHLRSRQRIGEVLRGSGIPVTEFRAAIIVGAGSISFQLIRDITDHLPVIVCPIWVWTQVQPIAIADVLSYLVSALRVPESEGKIIEIGGSDVLTYRDMMLRYARARHKIRLLITVPAPTPHLSPHWLELVTTISPSIALALLEGLRNRVVVRDDLAYRLFPEIRPMSYANALRLALSESGDGKERACVAPAGR